MHEYDVALKSVLRRLNGQAVVMLTGFAIARWHNVELPEVRSPRVDMLGETNEGVLVHVELQSTSDARMALRMAEYSLAIFREYARFPEQIVLYVGEAPLRMEYGLQANSISFRYRMVDVRELDGAPLLASGHLDDNVLAVLLRLQDRRATVQQILVRIANSEAGAQLNALSELLILAGLRSLGELVRQETTRMPVLNDIMDHDYLGPALRLARREGEQVIVSRQIEKRFGPVPTWAQQRLDQLAAPEMEQIALRLLDAHSIEELLS